MRGGGGESTSQRYNLTLSINARNLFNTVNLSNPVGSLSSPNFGESLSLAGGGFGPGGGGGGPGGGGGGGGGFGSSANKRRIDMSIRFSF